MSRTPNLLAAAAAAFVIAAFVVTSIQWPQTADLDDPDPALKAYALLAGASLLVPATVCWVGSVVGARLNELVSRRS